MIQFKGDFGYYPPGEWPEQQKASEEQEEQQNPEQQLESERKEAKKTKKEKIISPEEKQEKEQQKENLKKFEDKYLLVKEIKNPQERLTFYLDLLKESKNLEEKQAKKKNKEIIDDVFKELEKDEPGFKEKKELTKDIIVEESKKTAILSNLVNVCLENQIFFADKEERASLFDKCFNLWQKELQEVDFNTITKEPKTEEEKKIKIIEDNNLKNLANFNQQAIKTALLMSNNVEKKWFDEETLRPIPEKEKTEIVVKFINRWLKDKNPFENIKDDKELLNQLKEKNISPVFSENGYQACFDILSLKGVNYQNLKELIDSNIQNEALKNNIEKDLINFVDVKDKDKKAQEIIKNFGVDIEKITPEESALEGISSKTVFELFNQAIGSDPEFIKKITKILENPQSREKLNEILNNFKKDIEKITESTEPEKKEEVKKATEKAKESLLKSGLILTGLAWVMLCAIIIIQGIEWANKTAKQAASVKIKL